jgi:hypothetical protein
MENINFLSFSVNRLKRIKNEKLFNHNNDILRRKANLNGIMSHSVRHSMYTDKNISKNINNEKDSKLNSYSPVENKIIVKKNIKKFSPNLIIPYPLLFRVTNKSGSNKTKGLISSVIENYEQFTLNNNFIHNEGGKNLSKERERAVKKTINRICSRLKNEKKSLNRLNKLVEDDKNENNDSNCEGDKILSRAAVRKTDVFMINKRLLDYWVRTNKNVADTDKILITQPNENENEKKNSNKSISAMYNSNKLNKKSKSNMSSTNTTLLSTYCKPITSSKNNLGFGGTTKGDFNSTKTSMNNNFTSFYDGRNNKSGIIFQKEKIENKKLLMVNSSLSQPRKKINLPDFDKYSYNNNSYIEDLQLNKCKQFLNLKIKKEKIEIKLASKKIK